MESEYRRIERAIRYIEGHVGEQPGLDEVSRYVGLSPCHFQRVFKRWTGVSPKRYLQFLTVENAKRLLRQSSSLLDTALEVGLSGPGRLHDLFVSVESMTPGQFKSGGAGVTLEYGFHETPFGRALLAVTQEGITDLWFIDEEEEGGALVELIKTWPAADLKEGSESTRRIADRIFDGALKQAKGDPINLLLRGTNFQIKVWQALLRIPEGTVVSYADVAIMISRPDAVRAVAGAVAKNPIAWLIPCHRVLRSSGELGGYRWGITRKKMMLARELGGERL
ncbi:MAG: methylated-DNA--[protein]-cysteine S-methyltransferase [bacterium]|nr:methylated-DNA--[protein]-cysteine S-methyltransferase [bacterium]MDT8366354.1 methylated-DNA--[protein]-cysteine S-methyltransferase [bacterium]